MRHLPRLALVLQTLIAAGTFIVAAGVTQLLTPLQTAWFRIVLSFCLVAPFHFLRRNRPRPARRHIPRLALLGLTGIAGNQVLFLHGIQLSPPLNGALFYAFTPVVVLLFALVFLGERLSAFKVLGVATAIVGVLFVLTGRGLDLAAGPARGDVLILLAVLAWAAYTLLGKPILRRYDAFTVSVWAFGFGALYLLPAAPWVFTGLDLAAVDARAWLGVLYLSGLTSGVAFVLWYWALRRLEASQVAVFTNLQPPATAALAWLVYNDLPGVPVIVGGLLVIAGVTLVQLATRRDEQMRRRASEEVARPAPAAPVGSTGRACAD